MKKRLLALSMAVVMAFGLTACGGSSSGNAGTTAAAGGSETTAAAAASGKTYKIKLHHDLAEDSSQHEGLVKFKDLVEEKSGGAAFTARNPASDSFLHAIRLLLPLWQQQTIIRSLGNAPICVSSSSKGTDTAPCRCPFS